MRKLVGVALALSLLSSTAQAGGFFFPHWFHPIHHIKPPVTTTPTTPSNPTGGGGGSNLFNPGVGFVVGVFTMIVVHELMGPPCARKGAKNGYDTPTFWRPLCKPRNVVSVRG